MDKIIIGFSRPKSGFQPFSWLIRGVQRTPYSHTYIKYYNSFADRWTIYQASGTKVNYIGDARFSDIEMICAEFEIEVTTATKKKTIQYAIDRMGTPYGVKQILGIGAVLTARTFGKKIKNPFADGNATMVCSELVTDILQEILQQGDTLDPDTAMPVDVYNLMISRGYKNLKAV